MMNKKIRMIKTGRFPALNKRMFSVTPFKFIDETGTGALLLASQSPMSPAFTLAIVFTSSTLIIGGYLLRHLMTSASEAQNIVMFPEDLTDFMFFVPNNIMGEFHRYLSITQKALDKWCNIHSIGALSREQLLHLQDELTKVKAMILNIRLECVYINDLDDTFINGHLEFINRHIGEIDRILVSINQLDSLILNFV